MIAERALLLLAIKEPGKLVDFDHILEKISRDVEFAERRTVTKEELSKYLTELLREGLVQKDRNQYAITEEGRKKFAISFQEISKQLNRSYSLVYISIKYYPKVADVMMPFLSARPVSVVKIFSGKKNPITEIDPLFVRYKRYKPRPEHIKIENPNKLMELVFDHCVDYIPYVHRFNAKEPDVFVLDIDAGERIRTHRGGFYLVREVAAIAAITLQEQGIEALLKFSGSRGFQIWCRLDTKRIQIEGDRFALYRDMAVAFQKYLERLLAERRTDLEDLAGMRLGPQITTSQVSKKEERGDQVLIDNSSMKPMGDVRCPFSIHYKTGLVSVPLAIGKINRFEPNVADPGKATFDASDFRRPAEDFSIAAPSPPDFLLKLLGD